MEKPPAPVEVSASQHWDGADGPWSTFALRVGTPAQTIRFLPGTSSTFTVVTLAEACAAGDGHGKCVDDRGGVFNRSQSSTWSMIGSYDLGFDDNLGFTDTGDFGHDTVALGYLGSGGPVVNNSVVGAVLGTEYYLSVLGLKPEPTNFTASTDDPFGDQNDPQPSLMQQLKNASLIPSLSYSYTAGAPYRLNKALGSLLLGGFDASQFQPSNTTFGFFSDQSRDLTVGIQAITTNSSGTTNLLPSGLISSYIDSAVADIYLPLDACQAFEKALGLKYNDTAKAYLLSDAQHEALLESNPSVTFTLTTAITGGPTFEVTLPYAGFDLKLNPPLVDAQTWYFPLQRAANDTQFTLGRTFLQEIYLIVDYERGNFSIHPKIWDPTLKPDIVTILPPSKADTTGPSGTGSGTPGASPGPTRSHGVNGGAVAGGVVGGILGVFVIVVVVFFVIIRPRRKKAAAAAAAASEEAGGTAELDGKSGTDEAKTLPDGVAEAHGAAVQELLASTKSPDPEHPELEGDGTPTPKPELEGDGHATPKPELEGDGHATPKPELEGDGTATPKPELEGTSPSPKPELEGSVASPGNTLSELVSTSPPAELASLSRPGELHSNEVYEMPGSEVPIPELWGSAVPAAAERHGGGGGGDDAVGDMAMDDSSSEESDFEDIHVEADHVGDAAATTDGAVDYTERRS